MSKRHLFSRSARTSPEAALSDEGLIGLKASTRVEMIVNGRCALLGVPVVSRDRITLIMENGDTIGLRFIAP